MRSVSRDPRLYIDDMIDAVENALRFSDGLDREHYKPGALAFEAIVRQIEVIGEAAAHLPPEIQAQAPSIPWPNLIGMRNRMIHGYFAIDPDIIWSVVNHKLPSLIQALKELGNRYP
jgi:uncharacterized protein with HEPN domain